MLPVWKFFIEKRQFTILLMLLLILWGGFAAIRITKESSPEVQIPVGIVTTILPGASAEDVERLITNKLEDRLANLPNLKNLTSVSRDSVSSITAEFNASADLDESIQNLKDEVDKARIDLPTEAEDPSVSEINFVDQPIQIISISADLPFAKFAELGDEVKNELQTVPGISRVDVSGVRNREIAVVVRKEDLARYNISLSSVVAAIGQANASLPVGSITSGNISYNIAFEGSLDDTPDIGAVPILNSGGQVIYVRDIADVSDGVEKSSSYSRVSVDGKPSQQALNLLPYKVRGQDVTSATRAVKAKLDELKETTLAGSTVIITYDTGEQIEHDLEELTRTGLITVALVMLALFATIGWREAIVAGLSIPLSFLIAFVGLWYSGNTFNFISLFSLILSIGILVDSGIVIVEAIHTRVRKFGDKKQAAFEALREYAWPLIGGTMTTVAVFFPLFFISGIVGEFIKSIPFTVICVLIASIFVALGLVPVLALLFSREDHSEFGEKQEEYTEKARVWYAAQLHRLFAHRKWQNRFLLAMVGGFVLAIMLPIFGVLKVEFFPQEDLDFLYVDIEMPAGTPLQQTDLVVRAVEETLYDTPDVESLVITVGATSEFSNNPQRESRYGSITINLPEDRDRSSTEVLEDIKERVAVVKTGTIRADQPSGGPPVGAPILIQFKGEDRDQLDAAIALGRSGLEKAPGATSIDTSNKNENIEFTLSVDRARSAELGLSPAMIASTLRIAIAGTKATSITGTERDVDIVVSLNINPNYIDPSDTTNTTVDAIRQIPITTSTGQTVLVGSVLTEGIRRSDTVIVHDDRKRNASLTANVAPGYTVKDVLASYNKNMEGVELPQGVEMSIGGENQETDQSFLEMGFALIAGLALMFVILVLAFNSFRFTSYLLVIVPLSLIGVFGGLALTLQPLSFPSLLGVIALAGVIINHAIILMDSITKRIAGGAGRKFSDIVVDAAVSRLRPIVLTTITTVIGMIPLIFASGLWGPLAFAILFGLSFAMILTLILIPVLVYRWPGKLPKEIERS
ncbi:efflux RND transporter permease subunit [Acetobacteraceae bacterium]|nr:efflux RND transporter permease subunit [Candidatus Parcubacteria bacterium]